MRNPTGMTLADLKPGQNGIIKGIVGDIGLKRRLAALGLVNGTSVLLGNVAPIGDPRVYQLLHYALSLRNEEAQKVYLQTAE